MLFCKKIFYAQFLLILASFCSIAGCLTANPVGLDLLDGLIKESQLLIRAKEPLKIVGGVGFA
jgi:hypothetical protein